MREVLSLEKINLALTKISLLTSVLICKLPLIQWCVIIFYFSLDAIYLHRAHQNIYFISISQPQGYHSMGHWKESRYSG